MKTSEKSGGRHTPNNKKRTTKISERSSTDTNVEKEGNEEELKKGVRLRFNIDTTKSENPEDTTEPLGMQEEIKSNVKEKGSESSPSEGSPELEEEELDENTRKKRYNR
jgi:hypothetical protein